jgi:hypothetical protein
MQQDDQVMFPNHTVAGRLLLFATGCFGIAAFGYVIWEGMDILPRGQYPVILFVIAIVPAALAFYVLGAMILSLFGIPVELPDECQSVPPAGLGVVGQGALEALISEARRRDSREGYDALLAALSSVEVYFSLQPSSETGLADPPMSVGLVQVGPLSKAVLFFTSKTSGGLTKPFAGLPWERALEMVAKMPEADGLVLQNAADDWLAFGRSEVLGQIAANSRM